MQPEYMNAGFEGFEKSNLPMYSIEGSPADTIFD